MLLSGVCDEQDVLELNPKDTMIDVAQISVTKIREEMSKENLQNISDAFDW